MRPAQSVEVEDGWLLLSVPDDARRTRRAPQVTAKARDPAPLKARDPAPLPTARSPPQRAAAPLPARVVAERVADQVGGTSCIVPQLFSLSPSSSPKTAADFLESDLTLEFSPLPPPCVPVEDSPAQVDDEAACRKKPAAESRRTAPAGEKIAPSKEAKKEPGLHIRRPSPAEDFVAASKEAVTSIIARPSQGITAFEDSFVLVSPTPVTVARRFLCEHPAAATSLLWACFAVLVLGELATTLWWLHSLGFRGLVVLFAPAGLGLSFGLLTVGPEQMIAIAVAATLAAMPALPAYSAVLLMMAPAERLDSCWNVLHGPMLVVLGMTYLVTALVPALRAERPAPNSYAYAALQSLEVAQKVTRSACVISAWLYAAVVLHVGAARLLAWERRPGQAVASWHFWCGGLGDPLFKGHGLVLTLHALGLVCATARQHLVAELGEDLLPRLLGAQRAKALRPSALIMHHGRNLLRRVPQLKRYTPPPGVVALVLAVRRTAPVLFPVLAILAQLSRSGAQGWPILSLFLGVMLLLLVVLAAAHERRALPRSSLRRLPLLLPSGIAPCTRKLLGYALVAAEGVERARGSVASFRARWKPASAKR